MARRPRIIKKREVPDIKYKNVIIGALINRVMEEGKKATACKIVYEAIDLLQKLNNSENGLEDALTAIKQLEPQTEVKSRRVGGATYQVPMSVSPKRSKSLAIRWLVSFSRKRSEKTMSKRLANELHDALNNRGASMKNKENGQKMAEANRAFAHLRW